MANHTNDMCLWLEKKVKACEDFLSATVLLKAALEAEQMMTVNDLIGRRQALTRVIDGLSRQAFGRPPVQRRHGTPGEDARPCR